MKFPPTKNEARISEIFSSIQGEGPHSGEKHIFVRFEECHMHCVYCDELDKVGRSMTQSEDTNQTILRSNPRHTSPRVRHALWRKLN